MQSLAAAHQTGGRDSRPSQWQCGDMCSVEKSGHLKRETGERTVNLLHFLLPTKLLFCTRSSDRGNNEVSVARVQGRYKLLTTWIMEWDN